MNELKLKFIKNNELIDEQTSLLGQLKEVNTKLVNSERVKSNFLSNIRNEINNPISAVLELSKNMLSKEITDAERERFSKLIFNEVFYLEFQLRNIINSAELEAGEISLSPSVVKINSILNTILGSFKHLIEKKNLYVHYHFDSNNQHFITDPEKLHLVLSNLVANAVRFCNENGNIIIHSSFESDNWEIRIRNSGESISKNDRSVIFDRFRQVEEGTNKTFMGHGLGLSVTKALLDIMNGKIELTDDLINGTEFKISLKALELGSHNLVLSENGNDFIFDVHDEVF